MDRLKDLGDHEWELVHTTYANALQSLERNEEMGERRLQVLFTVASAAAVAVGLVADGGAGAETTLWAAAGAASVVSLIGLLTVLRLAHRNNKTTELMEGLRAVRQQVAAKDSQLSRLFPYDPYEELPRREQELVPKKGGLVDVAGCSTAAFTGATVLFVLLALDAHEHGTAWSVVAVALSVLVAVGVWRRLVFLVRGRYEKGKKKPA